MGTAFAPVSGCFLDLAASTYESLDFPDLAFSQEKVGPESNFANLRAFWKPESLQKKKTSLKFSAIT
jgi:hypothetical protein